MAEAEQEQLQRELLASRMAIASGRDIGTMSKVAAHVKLDAFFDASGAFDQSAVEDYAAAWKVKPAAPAAASVDHVREAIRARALGTAAGAKR